jgi:TRAP-type C4-dicarboxylate transport system permease small subunit
LASLARGIFYAFVCAGVVSFVSGSGGPASSNSQSRDLTVRLMSHAGGRWLVLLIGLGVAGAGLAMAVGGVRRTFRKHLRLAQMSSRTRKVVEALGVVGTTARGIVFGVIGVFLVVAAVTFDPAKAQGLDGALRKLATTPLGPWLLVAVALGLVIFGVYSWCEARWRKIQPG